MTANPATQPAIERTLDLRATPDRIWRAITDPAELSGWFGRRCALDVRPGGCGWFEWDGDGRFEAIVEAVAPGRFLAWRWAREAGTPVEAGPSTLVEITLEPRANGGTRLRLRESGFERPADRVANSGGWHEELADLAEFVAEHRWEAGIRKQWALASAIDRAWDALADPAQLAIWWSGNPGLEIRTGAEGWFIWAGMGRFACRFEAVEPPHYLCWRWVVVQDVRVDDAAPMQVLRTEWFLAPRDDGGTDLRLVESGFAGPEDFGMNDGGWDGDVVPGLRRHLGEG